MRSRALPLSLLLAASAGSAACTSSIGDDYAVSATWLINGIPPDDQLCADYGVDRIRLRITSSNQSRVLEAPCSNTLTLSDGYDYGGFDTTFAFAFDRAYTFEVSMIDVAGKVVLLMGSPLKYSGNFRVRDRSISYYELAPLELFSPYGNLADVQGSFTINGSLPTPELCAKAGISKVYLDLASATDSNFDDYETLGQADCADGVIIDDTSRLARGEYYLRYVAVDDAGNDLSARVPLDNTGQFYEIYAVDRPGTITVTEVSLP